MYQELRKLFKSSFVYTLGNILNRGLFLISMPIMTRYLVPSEYGTLSIVNIVISITTTCFGLAIPSFATRYYYEYDTEDGKKHFLGAIISFIIPFALVVTVLLLIFGDLIFSKLLKDVPFSPYMILGICISFLSMFEIIPDELFRIRNEAILFISIKFSKTVLGIALAIISVVILKQGAEGPLSASLIASIIFGFYYIFYLKDKIRINISISIIKQGLKFSLPVLFFLLGRVLLDSLDRLIMQGFVDLSVVGFYSVGCTIGSVLVMISTSINFAWIPFFYEKAKEEKKEVKEIFAYSSLYIGSLIIFLGLCPAIYRHEIIHILAPPSYYPIIDVIPYIMIGAILNGLFIIPVRGILQQKKTSVLPFIILVSLIVNVFLNFILIPKFQMIGAACANIVSSFVMLSICYIISQKLYNIPYQHIRLLKVLIMCVIFYTLSLFVSGYTLIISILLKTFILMLFPLALYLFRYFERKEIEKIKQLIAKFFSHVKSCQINIANYK